jgi:enamine deaminase RidA (YjgF/YER057c/UK114 family)
MGEVFMSGLTFPNPSGASGARGYSHLSVAAGPGKTIYVAGTFGMKDGKFAGAPGDFRAQCEQAFANVKQALAEGGATFKDVARITNYFVDMADLPVFFEVRDRYVNTKAPPASTAFQVVKLARDEALFEIEAIAFVAPTKAKPAKKKAAKKRR